MSIERKLWLGLIGLLAVSFSVLLWVGTEIHRQMPPVPEQVVTTEGSVVYTRADIETGRQVWQSMGGHQLGSIWGHGSYVAPDWTADWLHREAIAWLDIEARRTHERDYAALLPEQQAALQVRLQSEIRQNGYEASTSNVTISAQRAQAMNVVAEHYIALFGDDPQMTDLRRAYAMKNGTVKEAEHRRALNAFI